MCAATERARIARDPHDVDTHHVTAMVVQAGAAQFLLDAQPAGAGAGLSAIKHAAGQPTTVLLRHRDEHTEIEVIFSTQPSWTRASARSPAASPCWSRP